MSARPADATAFAAGEEDAGKRLDRFLDERLPDASRTRIQKWIEGGGVRVNGEPARKSLALEPGDAVAVEIPADVPSGAVEPEDLPLEIVHEDKHIVVVNKAKGMVTHPGHGAPSGTLANALAFRFKALSDLGGADRPGIVHRLDRDTTGLLVVARNNAAHAALAAQIAARTMKRTYRALVWREPAPEGTYEWPLGRHEKDPTRRAVRADGKAAITHWRILDWYQFAAQAEVNLETGRTHQIRVHFAHAGHPVVGDGTYGGGEAMLGRVPPLFQAPAAGLLKRLTSQALHAVRLEFKHPKTGKKMSFETPLPGEYQAAVKWLEKYRRKDEE